jgi:hypothetical protein
MKAIQRIIMAGALVSALTTNVFAQTNLQFTGVSTTDEGAIRLSWASTNHEVYQIQCADALIDTNTGVTTWQILYDNYPSQGTNTFWLDTGDYLLHVPPIVHPKYSPMRFYRIVDKEADTITDETVSIVSPANGTLASNELTVTVVASTNHASLSTKLYVDGQEMWPTKDGSNYVINTCEWGTRPAYIVCNCRMSFSASRRATWLSCGFGWARGFSFRAGDFQQFGDKDFVLSNIFSAFVGANTTSKRDLRSQCGLDASNTG